MSDFDINSDPDPGVKIACDNLNSKRILVVDDDLITLEIARDALEGSGFTVVVAEGGEQAQALFESETPDLVLLDVEMPGLDGFGVCERLRALPAGTNTPIIMMTGRGDDLAVERAFEVEATDFVNKPLNWAALVQRIRYILRAATTFKELKRSQQRLLSAQRMAGLGYWDWDMTTDLLYLSEQSHELLGHSVQTLKTLGDYVDIVHGEDRKDFLSELNDKVSRGEHWLFEHRVVTADGETRWIKVAGETSFADAGSRQSWSMGTMLDITAQRHSEETIRRMAFYDDITGLHNRVAFMEELKVILDIHKRSDTCMAVLYLDVDDFKRVNDSVGHHVGDLLLKAFAARLVGDLRASDLAARSNDTSVLARLGGDEFCLLLAGLKNRADAAVVASRIKNNLTRPFSLEIGDAAETHDFYVGASIGIAVYPGDGEDAQQLLKNADTAMYAAKAAGKNTHRFYIDKMNDRALERLDMDTRLRSALDRGEFTLHYQPKINLTGGDVVGVEALLRWQNPDLGNVPPGEFIPLAEETGQIVKIGEWVLETACRQAKRWHDNGLSEMSMAVNVSGVQFRQDGLEKLVGDVLARTGLDARFLELELTEGVVMGDVEQSIATLQALKSMGVVISIDDFGTGYSSLSYLRRFPIDVLKVDQSFVQSMEIDSNNLGIAKAVIAMGHSLGFELVAEGVENQQQLEILQAEGCEIGQGYLFCKPIPAEKIPEFIALEEQKKFFIKDEA